MENIYLISPNFVREITNVSSNIQDKFLVSAIRESCDMELQELVGSNLYEKLKSLVADDSISYIENIAYKRLLEHSKYFLAYSVISRLAVISSVKIDNIGANQTSDDKVNPLSIKDVFQMENYYHNKADYYKKRLQDFLLKNMKDYPELDACICNTLKANLYSASHCNVWLGGRIGKRK